VKRSSRCVTAAALAVGLAVLTLAEAAAQAGGPPSGRYECWFQGRARGLLNFTILSAGRYADVDNQPGTYTFDGRVLTFHGGSRQRGVLRPGRTPAIYLVGPSGSENENCDFIG
jgi:hypothetical protein